jgi:hypothetical protein
VCYVRGCRRGGPIHTYTYTSGQISVLIHGMWHLFATHKKVPAHYIPKICLAAVFLSPTHACTLQGKQAPARCLLRKHNCPRASALPKIYPSTPHRLRVLCSGSKLYPPQRLQNNRQQAAQNSVLITLFFPWWWSYKSAINRTCKMTVERDFFGGIG